MARTFLRTLLTVQHLTGYEAFALKFRKVAEELAAQDGNPALAKLSVSPRSFERWCAGTVQTLPRPDTCRVLEAMFGHPGTPTPRSAGPAGRPAGTVRTA